MGRSTGGVHACSIMSDSLQLHGLQSSGSSVHGVFRARILEWVPIYWYCRVESQLHDSQLACGQDTVSLSLSFFFCKMGTNGLSCRWCVRVPCSYLTGSPTKDWLLFLMLPMSSKDGHCDKTYRGFCGPFQQWDSWKRCNLALEDGIRPGSDCQSNTHPCPPNLSRGWPAGRPASLLPVPRLQKGTL